MQEERKAGKRPAARTRGSLRNPGREEPRNLARDRSSSWIPSFLVSSENPSFFTHPPGSCLPGFLHSLEVVLDPSADTFVGRDLACEAGGARPGRTPRWL